MPAGARPASAHIAALESVAAEERRLRSCSEPLPFRAAALLLELEADMRNDSTILFSTGAVGGLLGFAALLADVSGVAAVLCGLVFALAALCLFTGWRFLDVSPLARYRDRQRSSDTRFE